MKAMLFIRLYTISANRDALNLAYDYHYFWQGEGYHHVYRGFMDKIWSRGKMPDRDSVWLLNEVSSLGNGVEIEILDVGNVVGRLNAFRFGVWKFPGVIVDGKKAQGRDECQALLSKLK